MLHLCRQAAVLILVSSVLAVATNALRPDSLPWWLDPSKSLNPVDNPDLAGPTRILLEDVRRHFEAGTATFVDARTVEDYAEGHLATAVNIPSTEKEDHLDRIFQMLPPDGLIIIYCEGGNCEASGEVFEFLLSNGFALANLKIFEPGWEVLSGQADLPVAREEAW